MACRPVRQGLIGAITIDGSLQFPHGLLRLHPSQPFEWQPSLQWLVQPCGSPSLLLCCCSSAATSARLLVCSSARLRRHHAEVRVWKYAHCSAHIGGGGNHVGPRKLPWAQAQAICSFRGAPPRLSEPLLGRGCLQSAARSVRWRRRWRRRTSTRPRPAATARVRKSGASSCKCWYRPRFLRACCFSPCEPYFFCAHVHLFACLFSCGSLLTNGRPCAVGCRPGQLEALHVAGPGGRAARGRLAVRRPGGCQSSGGGISWVPRYVQRAAATGVVLARVRGGGRGCGGGRAGCQRRVRGGQRVPAQCSVKGLHVVLLRLPGAFALVDTCLVRHVDPIPTRPPAAVNWPPPPPAGPWPPEGRTPAARGAHKEMVQP